MLDISIHHIKMQYYKDVILKDINFDVHAGDKIGLVGNNGCGKTSLFKIIMGIENPLSGTVHLRKGVTLGYLAQIPTDFYTLTVGQVLELPFKPLFILQKEMHKLEQALCQSPSNQDLLNQYSQLQEKYEHSGGYTFNIEIERIAKVLRLNHLLKSPFDILSGGEKTRVALAKILLEKPEVLLLDEPTNHLDVVMLEWLEQYIATYLGAVIIISHDRYFLDQVAEKIIEISNGVSYEYFGNYSFYQIEKQKNIKEK